MYIKSCILASFPRFEIGNTGELDNSISSYIIPSCRMKMCRNAFMFFIGIERSKYFTLQKEAFTNHSIISNSHGSFGKRGFDSNKYQHEAQIATQSEIEKTCTEHSIAPPWHIPPREDGRSVRIMPPQFNKDRVYRHIVENVPSNLFLSRLAVYELLQ